MELKGKETLLKDKKHKTMVYRKIIKFENVFCTYLKMIYGVQYYKALHRASSANFFYCFFYYSYCNFFF